MPCSSGIGTQFVVAQPQVVVPMAAPVVVQAPTAVAITPNAAVSTGYAAAAPSTEALGGPSSTMQAFINGYAEILKPQPASAAPAAVATGSVPASGGPATPTVPSAPSPASPKPADKPKATPKATPKADHKQWLQGDLDGLNAALLDKLAAVGQKLGRKLQIDSGHRTRAEQAALYARYKAGKGPIAAEPGKSNHESGNAADVKVAGGKSLRDDPAAKAAALEFGLKFPVASESWHVEVA